jgi:Flp pilus assembly pilin Flp
MKSSLKRKEGQAMVEYIIIVAVVAIAALVLFGMFGDTIKKKLGGAVDELDGGSAGQSAAGDSSLQQLQDLGGD